ncbi:MAG: hypothetical protein KC422_00600 [Trueperaceae bacterium]|nr:hypothetical protein [Trueperaceae bacterium]
MTKQIRLLFLALVIGLGIFTILATSKLPPASLFLKPSDYYGKFDLCPGEKVTLAWFIDAPYQGNLIAEPLEHVEPSLNQLSVEEQGELEVQILGDALIRLKVIDGKNGSVVAFPELKFAVMTEEVCSTFDFNPVGSYSGKMQQLEPIELVFDYSLMLYWQTDLGLSARLFEIGKNGAYNKELELLCSVKKETTNLTCQTYGAESLVLKGTLTAEGYKGSYQGQSKNADTALPFSGAFNFVEHVLPSD